MPQPEQKIPHILVANDDGIESRGLRELVLALSKIGEVMVAAPDRARSATGHSITLHKPLRADRVEVPGASIAYSVSGTPTDCVALAIRHLCHDRPNLVISGINYGANLGWDLTYSGTVAAAVEGSLLGIPAIAISLASHDPVVSYEYSSLFAQRLAAKILKNPMPPFTLLNINVPFLGTEAPHGTRVTRQGKRRYDGGVTERHDPAGRPYYWLGGEVPEEELTPGSDTRAIIDGYISVTPIHLDLTAPDLLETLRPLFEEG